MFLCHSSTKVQWSPMQPLSSLRRIPEDRLQLTRKLFSYGDIWITIGGRNKLLHFISTNIFSIFKTYNIERTYNLNMHQVSFSSSMDCSIFSPTLDACLSKFCTPSTHFCLVVSFSHSNSIKPCAVLRPKQHLSSVNSFTHSGHAGIPSYTP